MRFIPYSKLMWVAYYLGKIEEPILATLIEDTFCIVPCFPPSLFSTSPSFPSTLLIPCPNKYPAMFTYEDIPYEMVKLCSRLFLLPSGIISYPLPRHCSGGQVMAQSFGFISDGIPTILLHLHKSV